MKEKSYTEKIREYANLSVSNFLKQTKIPSRGLNKNEVEKSRKIYGSNILVDSSYNSIVKIIYRSFCTPFSIVLFILGIISLFTEILIPESEQSSYSTSIIILSMVILSGIIRFSQEIKNKKTYDNINNIVKFQTDVYRNGKWIQISNEELVVGDYIRLKINERVPCDIKLIKTNNCFVSQSLITGESNIRKKDCDKLNKLSSNITDFENILFLGSTITSGTCEGVVIAVGKNSVFGEIKFKRKASHKGFESGANSIVKVFIKFMLFLVPIVFIVSGISSHNILTSFLFALSVAVGLTPELLPIVITVCLGKGTFNMRKKQTIVKNVNAMEGFGRIDTLCVDKTGTLTGDKLILEYYMDILGNEDKKVLDMAYLTSFYNTGFSNHIDNAILSIRNKGYDNYDYNKITDRYRLYKENQFDYTKKCSSVILQDVNNKKYILITKGNVENVINECSYINYKGTLHKIESKSKSDSNEIVNELTEDGMKVIAIAYKEITNLNNVNEIENNLILTGYIAFFDAPKTSSKSAIKKLKNLNVNIKVLTGDSKDTSISICKRLGLDTTKIITGKDFELLNDNDIQIAIENTIIFAELIPNQKAKIVSLLKSNGHKVGYLGDGINDLPAIAEADIGISVDTAEKSVKEMSDVVLLKKDLNVLEEGIIEGRKAFANMLKYIKITASSNFGNILGILIASLILPFFPMTSLQILLLNLLYDVLCFSLPWDNVDDELYEKPLEWSGKKLSGFMVYFGIFSAVFDVFTFMFLLLVLCPYMAGGQFKYLSVQEQNYYISIFQTGWFLESMWTQVLLLQLLRTKKLPFIQSKTSKTLLITTVLGITFFSILSLSPIGNLFGFTKLCPLFFIFLVFAVICYLLLITLAKKIYIKKNKKLL